MDRRVESEAVSINISVEYTHIPKVSANCTSRIRSMQKDEATYWATFIGWVPTNHIHDAPQGGAANWDLMFWNPNRQ